MSTPRRSLNGLVPWMLLLDELELSVSSPVLPARMQCPLCKQGQLIIVEDNLAGGEWFHCRGCGEAGDMIELAAAYWKLSISGTIRKLALRGFDLPVDDASIGNYKNAHIEYRKRLRRIWRQAQSFLFHRSATLRSLLCEMQLPYEFAAEQWNTGPAKILGGELCKTIEQALLPGSMTYNRNETRPVCRSARRIFRGGGWKEALMWPFYAGPGRICAYGFIGRDGDMSKDYVYRRANVNIGVPKDRIDEGGLAMHPDAHDMAVDWGHTIFAVSDPLLYLRLQLQKFTQSNNPLPLVLWVGDDGRGRTLRAWRMFDDCRIVFWDPGLSHDTLRQAIKLDGWIAICGPSSSNTERLHQYLWQVTPTMLCRKLRKRALPWPKALAKKLPRWTNVQIEDLFVQLHLDAPQIEKVRKACPRELRQRLDLILKSEKIQRFICFHDHFVIEQPDGWYCRRHYDWGRQPELVCNAKLRLSQVVTYNRAKQILYVGTITFNGEEIPFTAPQKEIERNSFDWMQQFLLERNKSLPQCNSRWRNKLFTIATYFDEPKVVQGTETVGWSHEKVAFLLPGRIIGLDGTRKLPLTEDVATFPAANLRYSTEPLPTNWHELADGYTLALFWASLAGVLSNVLAPALFQPTQGIGLVGQGAQTVGVAVAKAAGCLTKEIRNLPSARKGRQEEQRHRWPLCAPIASTVTSAAMTKWLEADQSCVRNCITPLDEENAERKRVEGGWHLLRGLEPATVNTNLLRLVRRLVPQYLRDLCRRQLKVEDVLVDLAAFVERKGGVVDAEKVREVFFVAGSCDRPRRKAMATAM